MDKRARGTRFLVAGVVAIMLSALFALPGLTQVRIGDALIAASATGTVLHADALETGDIRLLDTEVATSAAAYDTRGISESFSELGRPISPDLPDALAYSRAAGLEVGLGVSPTDDNQVILAGEAEAHSPPVTPPDIQEIGPVDLSPLAWATLLRSTASATAEPDVCTIRANLARSSAEVTDVQLLETDSPGPPPSPDGFDNPLVALDSTDPDRAVSTSRSRNLFVSQTGADGTRLGDHFGVLSEVRQTVAPVTLFRGTLEQLTIEVLGEWVLQAVATGIDDGAFVHYGPDVDDPSTAIVRLTGAFGNTLGELTFQDLLGGDGLVVTIPGLLEIAIGEPPREIGGPAGSSPVVAADGTLASAAVDVVRVSVPPNLPLIEPRLTDLRIGHMEVSAEVPQGGVACPLPVTKSAVPGEVVVGEDFVTLIAVTNPYGCSLVDVRIVDEVSTQGAARFEFLSATPAAVAFPEGPNLTSGTIVWEVDELAPGATVLVSARLLATAGPGVIEDIVSAEGIVGECPGDADLVGGVDVSPEGARVDGEAGPVRVTVVEPAETPTPDPNGTPTPTPDPNGTPDPTPDPNGTPTPDGTPDPTDTPTPDPTLLTTTPTPTAVATPTPTPDAQTPGELTRPELPRTGGSILFLASIGWAMLGSGVFLYGLQQFREADR